VTLRTRDCWGVGCKGGYTDCASVVVGDGKVGLHLVELGWLFFFFFLEKVINL
jgi:hypothetical protein